MCADCNDGSPEQSNDLNYNSYLLEKDPVYSANRGAVFFVTIDTGQVSTTSITFAEANMPIRQTLAIGSDITSADETSLSVALFGTRLMYLAGGARYECSLSSQPACSPLAGNGATSLSYFTDTSFVFSRNDSLFLARTSGGTPSFLHRGAEPRMEQKGQIIFVASAGGTGWAILRYSEGGTVETLYTGATGSGRAHWPDLDDTDRWLVYTSEAGGAYEVQTVELVQHTHQTVATAKFARTCIIPQGLVLFTDATGSLYQIGFRGGTAVPWVYVKSL